MQAGDKFLGLRKPPGYVKRNVAGQRMVKL